MYFLLERKGKKGYLKPMEGRKPEDVFMAPEEIHGCVMEKSKGSLMVCVQVPLQERRRCEGRKQATPVLGQGHAFQRFAFVIRSDGICFVDYDGGLLPIMEKVQQDNGEKTPEQLLYRIFWLLIENDLDVLDVIYKQLAYLEEEIPKENARFFLQKMYTMKHSIYQLFRYYHQLTELADDLMEWDNAFLDQKEMECFSKFIVRTKRLSDDIEIMREYAMEIWEIYQSQISIRQNDIMKILTIVTTIFLPLSLLAGWYGMNFEYMPELSWKYGYAMVSLLGILIVVISLLIFKKKRYW